MIMAAAWTSTLLVLCATWSAGLLVTGAVLSLRGEDRPAAVPSTALAGVLALVALAEAVTGMPHPERVFHLLANPSSAITQQLYAAILAIAVAVVLLVAHSRSVDGELPVWAAIAAVVAGILLAATTARRHMLPSEPLTYGAPWALWVVGVACVLGPATVALLRAACGRRAIDWAAPTLVGCAAAGGATSLAYGLWAHGMGVARTTSGLGMDFTNPTAARGVASSLLSSGEASCLLACAITALVIPLVCALAWLVPGVRGSRGERAALAGAALVAELACALGVLHAVL